MPKATFLSMQHINILINIFSINRTEEKILY